MTPIIRIDAEVMAELKKRAISLGLVFEPPNATLRGVLGLDTNCPVNKAIDGSIEFEFRDNDRKYGRLYLRNLKNQRHLLPGFRQEFEFETDAGTFNVHVYGAPEGTPVGDPNSGKRIRGKLRPWFDKHPELKVGDKLRIAVLEPGKRYKLSIVDDVKTA